MSKFHATTVKYNDTLNKHDSFQLPIFPAVLIFEITLAAFLPMFCFSSVIVDVACERCTTTCSTSLVHHPPNLSTHTRAVQAAAASWAELGERTESYRCGISQR